MFRGGGFNPAAVAITGGTATLTSVFANGSIAGAFNGVTTSGVELWGNGSGASFMTQIDATQTANNRVHDFSFQGGTLLGRFVNDAFGAVTTWVTVTGGQAAGVTSIAFGAPISSTSSVSGQLLNLAGIETGLTAHAGGTQGAAFALSTTKSVHNVTTVGTAADSVVLPAGTGSGQVHWVKNSAAANSMQLFAVSPGTIDGVATGTGVAIAAGKSRMLVDIAANTWVSLLGA